MMLRMRTTVTLDDDVAAAVQRVASERGLSFKAALNTLLRAGLAPETASSRPYEVPSRPMGLRPGIDLDKALRLAGELEDEETIRKLQVRK
jgi:hypothetical protein